MLETMHENDLFDMSTMFSNVVHIFGVTPATLHCVLQNDHSVRCTDRKLTSAAPWDNKVAVTSHFILTLKGICQLCSKQWYGSYHCYLRPSKWQRQLFLLTCFMSSYDRFICKNTVISYVGLCCCIVWPSFLVECSVKIWATCEKFLGK